MSKKKMQNKILAFARIMFLLGASFFLFSIISFSKVYFGRYFNFILLIAGLALMVFLIRTYSIKIFKGGLMMILIGGLMNLLVIATNNFQMPVITQHISYEIPDTHIITQTGNFLFLGDWINLGYESFWSPGDIVSLLGGGVMISYLVYVLLRFYLAKSRTLPTKVYRRGEQKPISSNAS